MTTQIKQTEVKLNSFFKHYGRTQAEQIKINQEGLAILKKWQQEDEKLTAEELKKSEQTWEMVKKNIDENRSRKFFS